MASTYCTPAEVAAQFVYASSFTSGGEPSLDLVNTFIAESGLDLERALAFGGTYKTNSAGGIDIADAEAYSWMKISNIQGTLYRLGQYLWSYGPLRKSQESMIPYQEQWPLRLEALRESKVNLSSKGGSSIAETPLTPTPLLKVRTAYGWSTDDTAQAAELTEKSASDHLDIPALPAGETSAYALLWISDAAGTPAGVDIEQSFGDQLGTFGAPQALTLDNVAGMVRVSDNRHGAGDVGNLLTVLY